MQVCSAAIRICETFCTIDADVPNRVSGFYTIAPYAVARDDVPAAMTKGLARYEVASFKLARIAIDHSVAGHGLGGRLLLAAALRCLRIAAEARGVLLIIDAKDERAARWYESYGAERLRTKPLTLVIPLATVDEDLRAKRLR